MYGLGLPIPQVSRAVTYVKMHLVCYFLYVLYFQFETICSLNFCMKLSISLSCKHVYSFLLL